MILEDGSVFEGKSFGAEPPAGRTFAEVVFQTGMVGYGRGVDRPRLLQRPVAAMTYPMVGNYGVPNNNDKDPLQPLLAEKVLRVR